MTLCSIRFFLLAVMTLIARPAIAATFEVELLDLRPVQDPTLHITVSGPILSGDAARLVELLDSHRSPGMRDILFIMDSPGGSLTEGLAIGQVIAALPEISSAQVGTSDKPNAICASACVLAYLGADYRYLSGSGRIGVHQFSAPDSEMSGSEALSLAQEMSAVLTEYIRAQRADPAFYERMAQTPPEGISWVARELLEEWRVVTGPIYSEQTKYHNVQGSVGLQFLQSSRFGDNSLTLICGDLGLVGVATLNKPKLAMYGRMELAVDGGSASIPDYSIMAESDTFVQVAFGIPKNHGPRLSAAKSFGARILQPSEVTFFGFEMNLRDEKLREMVASCGARNARAALPAMKTLGGIDFPGGDITQSGLRDISFGDCVKVCEADVRCIAISYVTDKRWCWPKRNIGAPSAAQGIMSAVK